MSVFHDEVEIEDFEYDEETETYYFPCPCGDRFAITKPFSHEAVGSSQLLHCWHRSIEQHGLRYSELSMHSTYPPDVTIFFSISFALLLWGCSFSGSLQHLFSSSWSEYIWCSHHFHGVPARVYSGMGGMSFLPHREELDMELRWFRHPGHLQGEVFQVCPTVRRPRGGPRTHREIMSQLAWEQLSVSPDELDEEDLENGEEVATCPSCSLIVKVIYDKELFEVGEIIEAPAHSKLEVAQS